MIGSTNEWDQLKEVIVGTADYATIPPPNISVMKCHYTEYKSNLIKELTGLLPTQIIDEQNEDLENLVNVLQALGVKVYRPDTRFSKKHTSSPTWWGENWHYHCPRDVTLVVGKTLIETPSPIWNRQFETFGYRDIFTKLFNEGYNWIKAPIPFLHEGNYKINTRNVPSLNNEEILFEAANCMRINNDILYQVSNTGNENGAKWLQRVLGDSYKVHVAKNIYSYAHLDSTIVPLKEGLVMYNASRVTPDNEPEIFKSWDKIWITECIGSKESPFGLPWGASEWIGMNVLSINEKLVIVDKKQKQIHEKLNSVGIETIPLELRHDRIISGGFHCVTLDLKRGN